MSLILALFFVLALAWALIRLAGAALAWIMPLSASDEFMLARQNRELDSQRHKVDRAARGFATQWDAMKRPIWRK